jgi:hypothetical protein
MRFITTQQTRMLLTSGLLLFAVYVFVAISS